MIDVGVGVEHHVGVTKTRLDTCCCYVEEQGYEVHNIYIPQINIPGKLHL